MRPYETKRDAKRTLASVWTGASAGGRGRRAGRLGVALVVTVALLSVGAPAPARALVVKDTPANKVLCAHFKAANDLALCKDACRTWPASRACLLVRRWGDAGTAVLIAAVKQKVTIAALGKARKLPPGPVRQLLLYADAAGMKHHTWVPSPPLDAAAQQRVRQGIELRAAAVKAHRNDKPHRVLKLLRQAHPIFLKTLGPRHPHTFETEGQAAYALIKLRRFKEADRVLQALQARQQAVYGQDHPNVADTLQLQGQVALAQRKFADARDLFGAAMEIAERVWGDDHPKLRVLWNNLAFAHEGLLDEAARLKAYTRALGISRRVWGPAHHFTATDLDNLGVFQAERARLAEAERLQTEALRIRKTSGAAAKDLASSYHNLGALKQLTGEFSAARRYLEQALVQWRRGFDAKQLNQASTMVILGQVKQRLGDIQGAMLAYGKALKIRKAALPRDHPNIARVLMQMGQLLDFVGSRTPAGAERDGALKRAGEMLTSAWQMSVRADGAQHPQTLRRYAALAGHWSTVGKHAKAAKALRAVIAGLAKAVGGAHPQLGALWNNLGVALVEGRSFKEAIAAYRKAEAALIGTVGAWHPDTQIVRVNITRLLLMLGRTREAKKQAQAVSDQLVGQLRANVAVAASDLALLMQVANLGTFFNATVSAHVASNDARGGLGEALRWQGAGTRAEVLWRQLRRARARGDATLTQAMADYERAQLELLIGQGGAPSTKAASRAATRVTLKELRARVARAGKRLAASAPELSGHEALSAPSVSGVCKSLKRAKASLVNYVSFTRLAGTDVEAQYGAFVMDPRGCKVRWVALGAGSEIESAVAAWREGVAKATRCFVRKKKARFCKRPFRNLDKVGQALRAKVWAPVSRALGRSKRTWIVPDGALTNVAFDGLPDAKGTYLVEERTLGYLPYGAAAMGRPSTGGRRAASGAFVAGDLDYAQRPPSPGASLAAWQVCGPKGCGAATGAPVQLASAAGTRGAAVCGTQATWQSLPQTEAATVAATLSAKLGEDVWLASGPNGSEPAIRGALPGRRVVHLATHGYFADPLACGKPDPKKVAAALARPVGGQAGEQIVDPMAMSAVVLSGANSLAAAGSDPAADGVLSAREVARLDLRGTQVVALSACETGLGLAAAGEGNLGLSRAFLVAGAQQTVVSLWQVPSRETAALFTHFYTALAQGGRGRKGGVDAVDAMRAARLALIRQLRGRGLRQSTFLWAAFVPFASHL